METKPLGAVLKAALLAGLVAGAVAAGFHSLVTEPVIDRAIQIEEKLKPATSGTLSEARRIPNALKAAAPSITLRPV